MKLFSEGMTRAAAHAVLLLRKNAPELYFVGGVSGMITSTIMACRATLKLEDTLDEYRWDGDGIAAHRHSVVLESGHLEKPPVHVVGATLSLVKLYAPSVIVASASVAMLAKSHNMLVQRNAALTAAYAVLDKGFRDYRARVVQKYGEDEDQKLRYGFEVVEVEDEKGKKITVERVGPDGASIYSVFYDQFNPNWSKDPMVNKLFLRSQQNFLNDMLHARGHLFLNEVYESLGFPHTQAGSIVGWIISPDHDNFIDLGVFHSGADDRVRDFVNGREGSVLLDFNVDGVIYDKIDGNKERISWQRS